MFHCLCTLLEYFCTCRKLSAAVILIAGFCSVAIGNTVEFTVLASADLHGTIEQLRNAVAPAVQAEFKRSPGKVIYVDTGDCAQGSWHLLKSRGQGILPELYRAGCTIFVPGNHELEFGFESFKKILGEFRGTILAANLYSPELNSICRDFMIIEKSGVRIAFIGLMLKNMEYTFPVDEKRFRTLPGSAVLRKTVDKAVAQGADVIILLRHAGKYGGGEHTYDLIKNVPEVDLVIGAHTHSADAGSVVSRAWFVQPPSHGAALAKINIIFDLKSRRIRQMKSSLLKLAPYGNSVPMPHDIVEHDLHKEPDFPAGVIRRKFNADLALYAVGSKQKLQALQSIPEPGVKDFYGVFSYFDPIITVSVSAGEFAAILREYAKFAHKRKQYLAKSGFSADINRGRVSALKLPRRSKRFTLALSAYAAAGAGGNLPETRRILSGRINYQQAENAPGILDVLCK